MKLSVILPVYNVEKYLRKCIDSILNQTFEDYELIIINDGSTDASKSICMEYAKNESRIKFINTSNNGLGEARNIGIRNAVGKYVIFIDSDDWVETNMFQYLIEKAELFESDLVRFGWFKESNLYSIPESDSHYEGLALKDDFIRKFLLDEYGSQAWKNMYKRDLFENIQFPNYIYEDLSCVHELILKSEKIFVTSQSLYHYLIRDNNISYTPHPKKAFYIYCGYKKRLDYVMGNNYLSDIYYSLLHKTMINALQAYNENVIHSKLNNEELRELLNFICKNIRYLNKLGLSNTQRLKWFVFIYIRPLYNMLLTLKKWRKQEVKI